MGEREGKCPQELSQVSAAKGTCVDREMKIGLSYTSDITFLYSIIRD